MDRRTFIHNFASYGALLPVFSNFNAMNNTKMGIVVHSYAFRWNPREKSPSYPGFANAIDLLDHCHSIGAGGIQTIVNDWSDEFVKSIREKAERYDMYIEGSISLPKTPEDVSKFEKNIMQAKGAGCSIVRSVCLSGRRYETFKSMKEFEDFKSQSRQSILLAEPVVRKHRIKLAIENHKDWRAQELATLLKKINSEWLGATLDFGNNMALLEDPMYVIETLAPYAFSTHIKDMGVMEYPDGFYLAEVPLGKGINNIKAMVDICKKFNPAIKFNLEMITRNPLAIPCKKNEYWATFGRKDELGLNKMMALIKKEKSKSLPVMDEISIDEKYRLEEKNNLQSLKYSAKKLGL